VIQGKFNCQIYSDWRGGAKGSQGQTTYGGAIIAKLEPKAQWGKDFFSAPDESPPDREHVIFTANPAHFAVLQMFVCNPGNSLDKPIPP